MMNWYGQNKEHWKEIIETVAREIKKSAIIVEKDTIQTIFLHKLFAINKNIVFKGGTSLSKVYDLIDRFSEDLDLSSENKLSESEKNKLKKKKKKVAIRIGLELINEKDIQSRYNYNKYYFKYNSIFANTKLEIVVETNLFLTVFPVEKLRVKCFVGEFCKKNSIELPIQFDESSLIMNVQTKERTFIDKVFAICDYKIQNKAERYSRHLYDIAKLVPGIKFDNELKDLIKKVRLERQKSKNNPSADSIYDVNELLKEIVDDRFFENDFNAVTKKLLFKEVNYDDIINSGVRVVMESRAFQ